MSACRQLLTSLIAGIVAITICLPASAGAPAPGPQVPKLFGVFNPSPGAWSEYSVVEKAEGKTTKMRMSIVGKEGDSFWYEVNQNDGQSRNIVKMLVKGNPNDPDNIQRLIIKSGDNPAAEMPKDFVAMGRKMAVHMFERRSGVPAGAAAADVSVVVEGKQQIKVPAGTFQASLRRVKDAGGKSLATFYFNDDVLPFGVISSETDSSSMELLAYGTDAQTAITETPVPMTTPPGMPTGMPRGVPPGLE